MPYNLVVYRFVLVFCALTWLDRTLIWFDSILIWLDDVSIRLSTLSLWFLACCRRWATKNSVNLFVE